MMSTFTIKNSLSVQLLKVVFTIYFLITIFMTLSQMYTEYLYTKNQIKNEIVALEDTFKQPLAKAIWNYDDVQKKSLLNSLNNLNIISGVEVVDKYGDVIDNFGDTEKKDQIVHAFSIKEFYDGKAMLLGKVYLYSNKDIAIERVKIGFYFIVISAIIKSIILWILLLWAFYKYLTKPLNDLSRNVDGIDLENIESSSLLKSSIVKYSKNELDIFKESFSNMLNKISLSKKELDSLNQTLDEKVKLRTKELETQKKHFEYESSHDSLTGIYNRRKFFDQANIIFDKSDIVFATMIDIDDFKSINDKFGHPLGDKVIIEITKIITLSIEDNDIFGRLGGDEFAIIFSDKNIKDVKKTIDDIRIKVDKLNIYTENMEIIHVTISIGMAQKDKSTSTVDNLLKYADETLYKSKDDGKNKLSFRE